MLYQLNFEKILFLDIETVPMVENYDLLPEKFRMLWDKKSEYLKRNPEDTSATIFNRAGIYAEFGKIVCISVGYQYNQDFRMKSFYGEDEFILLQEFAELLNRHFNHRDHMLCAHNGKEFDYPYIARRMLINGIPLPQVINLAGKKPWEVPHLDTMELWKFGDYKNYTSLELLTAVFGIPTPKEDIDGSMVADVYYKEKNLERIAQYCQRDMLAVAQLLKCYLGKPMIKEQDVVVV
ncbi:MAG: 3'-5' exonuclease [Bacteroidales bacterium]|nr:3'-5' exonuclease [Bacteroidales bacterium]